MQVVGLTSPVSALSEVRTARRSRSSSSAALNRRQCLRRIYVEEGAVSIDRDFRHRLDVTREQMARADVTFERHQFAEKAPRPQDRIAAPAVADRDGY